MRKILITGADGYLGGALARHLLDVTDHAIHLWCHAADSEQAALKHGLLTAAYTEHGVRVTHSFGDLREPDPFNGVDPGQISHIIHAAAVTRFNVERELARATNGEGSRRLLEFARRCGRLERVGMIGSLYAAGLMEGEIAEAPLPTAQDFANHYEWSKRAGEDLLNGEFPDLPASIFRVATVIADDATGRVSRFNAIHNSLRLLFHGLLSLLPGAEHTRIYLVTRNLAARRIASLMLDPAATGTFHVSPGAAAALSLGDFRDVVYEQFSTHADFRNARILKPLLSDLTSFEALVEGVNSIGGPVLKDVVQSIAPFAPQLYRDKGFDNARLIGFTGPWSDPDGRTLVARTCDWLVQHRWAVA